MGWFSSGPSFNTSKSARALKDYFMGKCGSCTYMDPTNRKSQFFGGYTYKCTRYGYQRLDDSCGKYDLVGPEKRDYADLYYEMTGRKYYYILTTIFKVLGLNQDNPLFQEIKALIQVVRSDNKTLKEALEYEAFGYEISEKLEQDMDAKNLCQTLLLDYLTKVYLKIKANDLESAIEIYKDMVIKLYVRYKNRENYQTIIEENTFNNSYSYLK